MNLLNNKMTRLVILAMSLGFVFSCKYVPRQAPEDSFNDGKLPPLLEQLANPSVLESSIQQNTPVSTVSVAIIDSGVDYQHPGISSRIRYRKEANGQISAGVDLYGNDYLPHPQYIDPSYFAFGAKLKDGKITEYLSDPLQTLEDINQKFIAQLKSQLSKRKFSDFFELMKSGDISELIHILGARLWYMEEAKMQESYDRIVEQKDTITSSTKFNSDYESSHVDFFYQKNGIFTMNSNGTPESPSHGLLSLAGFDKFFQIVAQVYEDFAPSIDFRSRYLDPYFTYRKIEDPESGDTSEEELQKKYMRELVAAWRTRFHQSYDSSDDPLIGVRQTLCHGLQDRNSIAHYFKLNETERAAKQRKIIDEAILSVQTIDAHLAQSPRLDPYERRKIDKQRDRFAAYLSFLKSEILNENDPLLDCTQLRKPLSNHYKKHSKSAALRAIHNPYLHASSSTENSHGTHVAGIVAAQGDDLQIVPVKVITESLTTSDKQDEALKTNLKQGLLSWLELPLVKNALREKSGEDTAAFLSAFEVFFEAAFKKHKLDAYFVNNLIEAIRWVGKEKIKIANISLGTGSSRGVSNVEPSLEQSWSELFTFLLYEYWKYHVSLSLTLDAPDTLFVIAAGNDSAWMDSESRTGIPCDVSSPFLNSQAQSNDQIPNHQIKNVICVMSLGKNKTLSPFTNLPLNRIPVILAEGEAVLSLVRNTDCSGVQQELKELYGEHKWPSLNDLIMKDIMGTDGNDEKKLNRERVKYSAAKNLLDYLYSAAAQRSCFEGRSKKKGYAKMSGTSMAAPLVAGFIAAEYQKELRNKGMSETDAYKNSDYSPPSLIRLAVDVCEPLGGRTLLNAYPSIPQNRICRVP